jgi:hypothetical protein
LFCDEAQLNSVLLTDMKSNGMPAVDVSNLAIEHDTNDSDEHRPPWQLLPNDLWTFIIEQLTFLDKLVRTVDGPSCAVVAL